MEADLEFRGLVHYCHGGTQWRAGRHVLEKKVRVLPLDPWAAGDCVPHWVQLEHLCETSKPAVMWTQFLQKATPPNSAELMSLWRPYLLRPAHTLLYTLSVLLPSLNRQISASVNILKVQDVFIVCSTIYYVVLTVLELTKFLCRQSWLRIQKDQPGGGGARL